MSLPHSISGEEGRADDDGMQNGIRADLRQLCIWVFFGALGGKRCIQSSVSTMEKLAYCRGQGNTGLGWEIDLPLRWYRLRVCLYYRRRACCSAAKFSVCYSKRIDDMSMPRCLDAGLWTLPWSPAISKSRGHRDDTPPPASIISACLTFTSTVVCVTACSYCR